MGDAQHVFDRRTVRRHRDRAAMQIADHDFLFREIGLRLAERLDDINRRFPLALDLGAHHGFLAGLLAGHGGIETLVQCDISPSMARRAAAAAPDAPRIFAAAADEEWLPFADGAFDLVVSCLSLHWVNDLPGTLIQIRRALKPDGLFLAAIFGNETLAELRHALIEAEIAECGGASPRVSPFADVRDAGGLLQRAGFALPVADSDTVTVTYSSALDLMRDLRGMGESNAAVERRRDFTRQSTILRAAAIYQDVFAGEDERVPATFQIVMLTGWAPHAGQQKPLRPGSAASRLATALGGVEKPAGEKPPRLHKRPE
ncbi:MAG: methyltransferase domain-containing protein [Rhodospirillales bacterium]|nr:methyltransferase domain-containing protein [Rhodospirillales bacterium]